MLVLATTNGSLITPALELNFCSATRYSSRNVLKVSGVGVAVRALSTVLAADSADEANVLA